MDALKNKSAGMLDKLYAEVQASADACLEASKHKVRSALAGVGTAAQGQFANDRTEG